MDACEHVQSMTQENKSKFIFTRTARYSEAMSSMCEEKLIYCNQDSCVNHVKDKMYNAGK